MKKKTLWNFFCNYKIILFRTNYIMGRTKKQLPVKFDIEQVNVSDNEE